MAEKKKAPQNDFSIDEILAEAHTLNGGEPPESRKAETGRGKPPELKAEAGQPEQTFAPEAIAEQAQNALKAKVPEPAPEVKKSKKSKKSFFRRSRREIPEFDEEEDIYYGLQLKSLEEYRDDYEKTVQIDSKKIRQAESESTFSYLFEQTENNDVDDEVAARFEQMHNDRRKRVEQALRNSGLEQDDIFSLYEDQPPTRHTHLMNRAVISNRKRL